MTKCISYVKPGDGLVAPERLANEPFGAIALDGIAQLSRGGDPEPGDRPAVGEDEDRHQAAAETRPLVVHLLKVAAAADALGRAESQVHGCPPMRVA